MIDRDLVEMLDSADPEDRIFAVKAMAKSKDPEYLEYLAIVYKTDDNPQVKQLALKAGKYIKKVAAEEEWTGGDEEYDEAYEDDDEEEVPVSAMNEQRAQSFVEQAMNLNLQSKNEKAAEMLAKAFHLNPNLTHDTYTVGLAASVTGYSDEMAVSYLTSDEFGKGKKKRSGGGSDETTWEEALIDLAVYWVVNAGVAVVSTLLLSRALTDLAANSGYSPSDFTDLNPLIGADIIFVLVAGFLGSLFQVVGLLIYYAAIHFAATSLFAGDGSFKGLIHKTANYLIVVVVVFSITGFIQQYNTVALFLTEDGGNTALAGISAAISFFGGIAAMFWFSSLIGQNYGFGAGKGCASVIAGIIGLVVLMCGCIFVITSVFGASLGALDSMTQFIPLLAY